MRMNSPDPRKIYKLAWIWLATSLVIVIVAHSLLSRPTTGKTRRIELNARSVRNLPAFNLAGNVSEVKLYDAPLLVSNHRDPISSLKDAEIVVQETVDFVLPGDDEQERSLKQLRSDIRFEIEPKIPKNPGPASTPGHNPPRAQSTQWLSVAAIGWDKTFDVDIYPRERFSLECPDPSSATFEYSEITNPKKPWSGFSARGTALRVVGNGTTDTETKLNLPVIIESDSLAVQNDNPSSAESVKFDIRLNNAKSAKLASAVAGAYSEDLMQPSPAGMIELASVQNLVITDETGQSRRSAIASSVRLNIKSLGGLSVALVTVQDKSAIKVSIDGVFESVEVDGKQLLPSYLEEIFTTNLRFTSAEVAAFVGLGLLLLLIIQRCIGVILDAHLPKPSKD